MVFHGVKRDVSWWIMCHDWSNEISWWFFWMLFACVASPCGWRLWIGCAGCQSIWWIGCRTCRAQRVRGHPPENTGRKNLNIKSWYQNPKMRCRICRENLLWALNSFISSTPCFFLIFFLYAMELLEEESNLCSRLEASRAPESWKSMDTARDPQRSHFLFGNATEKLPAWCHDLGNFCNGAAALRSRTETIAASCVGPVNPGQWVGTVNILTGSTCIPEQESLPTRCQPATTPFICINISNQHHELVFLHAFRS